MTNKSKKATRKFESRHLKDTLERRKDFAKIKQRHHQKDKKKARKERERDDSEPRENGVDNAKSVLKEKDGTFGDMSVEEFLQGGFAIPEEPAGKKRKRSKGEDKSATKSKRRKEKEQEGEGGSELSVSDEDEETLADLPSASEDEDEPEMSKADLDALAEKDPEFYKFLQQNDAELLEFDENGDLANVGQLSGSDEEDDKKKTKKSGKKQQEALEDDADDDEQASTEVTLQTVKKWETSMAEIHSLRAAREVVLAFRAAAHVNEDSTGGFKYAIGNPDVYHELLNLTLKSVPTVLNHHLPIKETASGKVHLANDSKKFRTLSPLLKSHASSISHFLESLSDDAALKLTLSCLSPLFPYFLSFKKLLRNLIRTISAVWSESSNSEATRISAFLALRRLMVIGDAGIRETVLKSAYQGLVRESRNTTIHTIQGINLMKNSAAELWELDQTIGYTTGFSFIRQLAIHLRGSITNTTKESYKAVYNWQYVHSLDFWSRVLSTSCDSLKEAESGKESPLRPLIYPAVQVTLGAMRLIPTAQYFPLRFQLTRSLLRISLSTGTYIPLAPALLEVLNSGEMKKSPKPSTTKAIDFSTTIRAPQSYLRTRIYQDGVGEQVAELLSEFFVLWTKNIAFPELALPVTVMLKRWLKEVSNKRTGNKNGKVNSAIGLLIQKLSANSEWIEERRAKVDFAPNNRAGVEGFLKETDWVKTPLGAFVSGQRKQREQKAKLLEQGRKEENARRKSKSSNDQEDLDDEVVDGVEEASAGDDDDDMEE